MSAKTLCNFPFAIVTTIINPRSCFRGEAHLQGSMEPRRGGKRRRGSCGRQRGTIYPLIELVERVRIPA